VPTCRRTAQAEDDLLALWCYIAAENPQAADRQLDRIEAGFRMLADHPDIGAARPDLAPGFRYYVVGSYLVLYRAVADGIEIVRVVHGARYLPDLI
jgi:toxin ParE1/3/4